MEIFDSIENGLFEIFHSIEKCPYKDCAITIGNFDGVHLGHQAIIQALKNTQKKTGLVTFSTHPLTLLKNVSVETLYTLEENFELLKENGLDFVICLPFTKELANQSYQTFLEKLKHHLHFSHLILGKSSTFGHNREGTEENVKQLSKVMDFEVEYLPKLTLDTQEISTSLIKHYLHKKEHKKAELMLSRLYKKTL